MKYIVMIGAFVGLTFGLVISDSRDARAEGDFCLGGWTLVPGMKSMYVRDDDGNWRNALVPYFTWSCQWDG